MNALTSLELAGRRRVLNGLVGVQNSWTAALSCYDSRGYRVGAAGSRQSGSDGETLGRRSAREVMSHGNHLSIGERIDDGGCVVALPNVLRGLRRVCSIRDTHQNHFYWSSGRAIEMVEAGGHRSRRPTMDAGICLRRARSRPRDPLGA